MLAGIDLTRLRSSPLYSKLPPAVTALLQPLSEARYLLLASDGRNLLLAARGPFHQPPAGATILAGDLVISGTPDFLASAQLGYKTRRIGAAHLIDYASTVAGGVPIWIAAQGGTILPLTGNAANLNRLLRDCDNAALTVRLDSLVGLSFTAIGRSPEAARHVEDTLRAAITLAAAGESRHSDLVELLHAIQINRQDRSVRADVSATPDAAQFLLKGLAP